MIFRNFKEGAAHSAKVGFSNATSVRKTTNLTEHLQMFEHFLQKYESGGEVVLKCSVQIDAKAFFILVDFGNSYC